MIKNPTPRPKRRANKSHFIRYLQTRNPGRLEEEDLRRALEASLQECPDYWPEDSAPDRSPSNQSNGPSSSAGSSTGGSDTSGPSSNGIKSCKYVRRNRRSSSSLACCQRSCHHYHQHSSATTTASMQQNHPTDQQCNQHNNCHSSHSPYHNNNHPATNCNCNHTANQLPSHLCCPHSSVHKRYKPVAKKNIYDEADFFHDGIMAYIEYELGILNAAEMNKNKNNNITTKRS